MWLNQKTNYNGNFDKINMFIFPKLGKQYYIWKMYAEFKLSKELSVVYFLSQLPKHYQEYENRIVVFINPDTSQLKSNSISIWTSKLPFPSIKTPSNIELGKSFKNKFTEFKKDIDFSAYYKKKQRKRCNDPLIL